MILDFDQFCVNAAFVRLTWHFLLKVIVLEDLSDLGGASFVLAVTLNCEQLRLIEIVRFSLILDVSITAWYRAELTSFEAHQN